MKTDIETLKKAFDMFKSKDELRTTLKRPFRQRGVYFATDAHSMIYMNDSIAELGYEEQDKPNAMAVIPKEVNTSDIIKIAELDKKLIPDMIPMRITCEECKGEGTVHCYCCGYDNDCNECEGKGDFEDPKGREEPNVNKEWLMLGVTYKDKQLRRLVEACKLLEIDCITKIYDGGEKAPTIFNTDKVSFLVMPCYNSYNPNKIVF